MIDPTAPLKVADAASCQVDGRPLRDIQGFDPLWHVHNQKEFVTSKPYPYQTFAPGGSASRTLSARARTLLSCNRSSWYR